METYRTEEEQVEAIKKWWRENGKSTVFGVALALALVFGWRGWNQYSDNRAAEASVIFDSMIEADALAVKNGRAPDTARHLANTLKSEYSALSYAQFAAMMLAKYDVDAGDYDAAEAELKWVLGQRPSVAIEGQVNLRLAKIKIAQQDYDAARQILDAMSVPGYAAQIAELHGDIALANGDKDAALVYYLDARTANRAEELPVNRPLLDIKINSLRSNDIAVGKTAGGES